MPGGASVMAGVCGLEGIFMWENVMHFSFCRGFFLGFFFGLLKVFFFLQGMKWWCGPSKVLYRAVMVTGMPELGWSCYSAHMPPQIDNLHYVTTSTLTRGNIWLVKKQLVCGWQKQMCFLNFPCSKGKKNPKNPHTSLCPRAEIRFNLEQILEL